MTSPKDSIQEALARNKTLAARLLVHAQDLAAQVAATEASVATAEHAPDLLAVLQQRLGEQRGQLEDAQREYSTVIQELDSLKKLMKDADHAAVVADLGVTAPGDGLSASAVDQALARVREHAAELDARVSLNRELGASKPVAAPLESPEDKARRQLDELKAARNKKTP